MIVIGQQLWTVLIHNGFSYFYFLTWLVSIYTINLRFSMCFLKPIFRCTPKALVLGVLSQSRPQRDDFALPIPTCWYPKSLADPTVSLTDQTRGLTDPTWSIALAMEVFFLFLSISFALCSKREYGFWWNMGFKFFSQGYCICENLIYDIHNHYFSESSVYFSFDLYHPIAHLLSLTCHISCIYHGTDGINSL